jgi:hypothetical protein
MSVTEDCSFERLLPDGSPVIRVGGKEVVLELRGLEIIQPIEDRYHEIFEVVLPRTKRSLRCELESMPERKDHARGRLLYFGWQDKSGDVWVDVAQLLLQRGLATLASGDFPEREEYEQYQRDAQGH